MDYPISKSMEAVEELRSQGKIGAVSVSNFPMQTLELAVKYGKIDIVQVPYSLLWRQHENDVIPFCKAHNIDMIATTSLGQGLLGGEVRLDTEYNPGENHMVLVDEYKAEALYIVEKLRAVATEIGTTLPKLALKWVLSQPEIKGILVCARTPEEMAEDVAACDLALSKDVLDRLTTISDELGDMLPVFPDLYGNWRGWNKFKPQVE
jgi:aryl-alcohol dehydrogenase-like predicted oxidoreductase